MVCYGAVPLTETVLETQPERPATTNYAAHGTEESKSQSSSCNLLFPNFHYLCRMPDKALIRYIEAEIIPRYEAFDKAHRTDHVRTVIDQSLALAAHYEVNLDMVYTVAAYHDIGLAVERERHHLISGELLAGDSQLRRWFTPEQIATMREAVEDHRASSDHAPRTIYGRIAAEADRLIDPETILRRTIQYGLSHYPDLDCEEHYYRLKQHLDRKYAENGYLRLWIPESDNAQRLAELRHLIGDELRLRSLFNRLYHQEITAR